MKSIASALWKVIDTLARAVISLIAKVSPKLGEKCLNLWNNTELVSYLFVGAATTLVNYVTYWFATRVLHTGVLLSNTIAWVVAVAFGYWANKTFVFILTSYILICSKLPTCCINFATKFFSYCYIYFILF